MSIDECIDYVEDINKTVTWDCEQKQDEDFFNSVGEMLEELKSHNTVREYLKHYLEYNEEKGVVYIPKFMVEKLICVLKQNS